MLPRIRSYMDTSNPTVRPEMPILAAVEFLLANHVTGAPVVDADNVLVGILTEKDCLRLISEGGDQAEYPVGVVADYMSAEVTTVSPNMNIYFVAGMFLSDVVRRFPVVEDGKVVGAITRFDILRAVQTNLPRRDER